MLSWYHDPPTAHVQMGIVQAGEKEFRAHYDLLKAYILKVMKAPVGVPNLIDHRVACL